MNEINGWLALLAFFLFVYGVVAIRRDDTSSGEQDKEPDQSPKPVAREETPYAQKQRQAQAAPKPKPQIQPQVITGKCHVIDGDTIVIKKIHIRLFGIDAPEMNHPYGIKSKWAMVHLCKGHVIRAEVTGEMSHNRVVAKCYLPDGRDLSEELVKEGLAIDWPKFSGGIYKKHEPPGVRRKLWRAAARQRGKMPAD